METINLQQALDIFEDEIGAIEKASQVNEKHQTGLLKSPSLATSKSFHHWWVDANTHQIKKQSIEENHNRVCRAIHFRKQPKTKDTITPQDIERAKEYSIHDLLNTQHCKGNISCPFHEDKNPSFAIKKNRFNCFSCGEHGDVIDLYQKLHHTDFINAVKALK